MASLEHNIGPCRRNPLIDAITVTPLELDDHRRPYPSQSKASPSSENEDHRHEEGILVQDKSIILHRPAQLGTHT